MKISMEYGDALKVETNTGYVKLYCDAIGNIVFHEMSDKAEVLPANVAKMNEGEIDFVGYQRRQQQQQRNLQSDLYEDR